MGLLRCKRERAGERERRRAAALTSGILVLFAVIHTVPGLSLWPANYTNLHELWSRLPPAYFSTDEHGWARMGQLRCKRKRAREGERLRGRYSDRPDKVAKGKHPYLTTGRKLLYSSTASSRCNALCSILFICSGVRCSATSSFPKSENPSPMPFSSAI